MRKREVGVSRFAFVALMSFKEKKNLYFFMMGEKE